MTYSGRVRVSYATRQTKLERLRALDGGYADLIAKCKQSELLWDKSGKTADERLHACSQVLACVTSFVSNGGADLYTRERMHDLLVAVGELLSGRHSVLLSPSRVHCSTFSAADLMQQGTAQTCVDLLRGAGAGASEARKVVAGLFDRHKLPRFGEAKLRALNSRLKGPGSAQDAAFDMYQWATAHAEATGVELGIWPINTVTKAKLLADTLIGLSKRRDHRHDFFFAPDANSSPIP